MNRNKMNENESLVDNENEEEDEVLEAPILLERVEDEDKEKDDDDVSKKNFKATNKETETEWYQWEEKTEVWCCHLCIQVWRLQDCQRLC